MDVDRQYKRIIKSLVDAIYVCDASGQIKLFNKAAAELWGREPDTVKDLFCGSWKVLNKDGSDLQIEDHPMSITIKEQRPLDNIEIIIQRPDGSFRTILHSTTPIYNVHGELSGAVNLLKDITGKANKM